MAPYARVCLFQEQMEAAAKCEGTEFEFVLTG